MKHKFINSGLNLIGSIPNIWSRDKIHIISDGRNWVISEISKSLEKTLRNKKQVPTHVSPFSSFLSHKVIHFNSITPQHKYLKNQVLMTWYHVEANNSRLSQLKEIASRIDILHTTANITKNTLIKFGFPEEKIVVLPMGIDLNVFTYPSNNNKQEMRSHLNIPQDTYVIGSFQKDGEGWGLGMNPKYVKGPDVFCDVVENVAKKFPIHVLLSGPARGYVKERLTMAGVNFTHVYAGEYFEMNKLFHACDLYLISSRNEGVPMALLESWATGVPLVSTRVGMVADVAVNENNALLADIEDTEKLAENVVRILGDNDLRTRLVHQGYETVKKYGWDVLIDQYWNKLYLPLLSKF